MREKQRNRHEIPVRLPAASLVTDPVLGFPGGDRADGRGGVGDAGEHRQQRVVGEHPGVDFDLGVDEAGVEEEVAVTAGRPRRGDGVGTGVDDDAGEFGVIGVDEKPVPVLPDQNNAPARGQHPVRLGKRRSGIGDVVKDLLRPVARTE